MKKRVLLIVLGVMFALPLTAQESWVRFYEVEYWEKTHGLCVTQTSDGGYAIYAYFYDYGTFETKAWLLKTNPQGDTLWTRKYGNSTTWSSDPLIESVDGSLALTGKDYGESYDVWLCKAGAYGDVIWERYIDLGKDLDEFSSSVQQTSDGGYIVTGSAYPDSYTSYVLLIKTDADGNSLWERTYIKEGGRTGGYSVQQTSDLGYIISTGNGRFGYNLGLIKTDSLGEEEWSRIYENKGNGWCVEQTTDGGYIIAANAAVIKTDSAGNVEWSENWGHTFAGLIHVRQTFDGGYILGTSTMLIKLDADGNILWERTPEFNIYSVRQTADTGYILTGSGGYSDGYHYYHRIFLCKTDSTGYAPEFSGVAEPVTPPVTQPDWQVVSTIGFQITLRYADQPQGFTASIFDATGQKVNEIHAPLPSGSISWGEGFGPGVYFIRVESGSSPSVQKVVLVH